MREIYNKLKNIRQHKYLLEQIGYMFRHFISVINQLDERIFLFYNKFISCLYMFRAHVLIIKRSKLHYTASGIIRPIGVMIPEAV